MRMIEKSYYFAISLALVWTVQTFAQASNGSIYNGATSQPTTPTTTPPPVASTPSATPAITNGTTTANPAGQVVNNPDGTQTFVQTLFCPTPDQLIKSGLFWGTATGGWKSYSESFDDSIMSFMGAQWVGINVGKMICFYKGNLAMSFPITVQNDTLAQGPTGANWGTDLGGYRNCHSSNVADCPFIVKTQSVNMQQIYQSLDFFKNKPNPLLQPNS